MERKNILTASQEKGNTPHNKCLGYDKKPAN